MRRRTWLLIALLLSGVFPLPRGSTTAPRAFAGDKPATNDDGPDLDSPTTGASQGIAPDDPRIIDRLLLNAVTRNISSEEIASLRRIRDFLRREAKRRSQPPPREKALTRQLARLLRQEDRSGGNRRVVRLRLVMLRILREEWESALRELKRLGPASERDPYHPLLLAYIYLHLMDYPRAEAQLALLNQRLRLHRDLLLQRPALCSAVRSYRLYTPLPSTRLRPGQNVLVYVELRGVAFKITAGNQATCRLDFGLRVRDEASRVYWSQPDYGSYNPTFMGPIRDMHASISLRIPRELSPGRYFLVIHCHDRTSDKQGECALPFVIGPDQHKRGAPDATSPRASGAGRDTAFGSNPETEMEKRLQREREILRRRQHSRGSAVENAK